MDCVCALWKIKYDYHINLSAAQFMFHEDGTTYLAVSCI